MSEAVSSAFKDLQSNTSFFLSCFVFVFAFLHLPPYHKVKGRTRKTKLSIIKVMLGPNRTLNK